MIDMRDATDAIPWLPSQARRRLWSRQAKQKARAWKAPDLVIVTRVALAFVTVAMFSLSFPFAVAAVVMTVVVIAMDALDGYAARKLDMVSDVGAVLDITGDRIVEHVFWIYFAVAGLIPIWVPIVVVTRSFVVDTIRGLALAADGATPFGDKTMQRSPVSRFLTGSRFMRNAYGVTKVAAFVLLGSVIALQKAMMSGIALELMVIWTVNLLAVGTTFVAVAVCVLRGLPVVWESRRYLSPVEDR